MEIRAIQITSRPSIELFPVDCHVYAPLTRLSRNNAVIRQAQSCALLLPRQIRNSCAANSCSLVSIGKSGDLEQIRTLEFICRPARCDTQFSFA
jgi:hypothetical protein